VVLAQLRGEIERGALTGRLPGMRALAATHGVSTFVIFQAVAALEAEGLVVRLPKRGIEVPAEVSARVRRLRLVFAEDQPCQQRFWAAVGSGFASAHPGIVTTCVFVPGRADLATVLADGTGGVVHSIAPGVLAAGQVLPLSAVLGSALTRLRAGLVPAACADDPTTLAYQLQPSALVYRHHDEPTPPGDWTWSACIATLARLHGPRRLVPPPAQVLADSVGLGAALAAAMGGDHQALIASATALVDILAACVAAEVLGEPGDHPEAVAHGLAQGEVAAVMRAAFLWPVFGLQPGGRLAVQPLPGAVHACPLALAVASGTGDLAAAAAWITHLMGDEVQRLIMVHGLGTAVQRSALAATVGDPGLPRGMAVLAARMQHCPPPTANPEGYPALLQALVERCLVPLVTGRLSAAEARSSAVAVVGDLLASLRHRAQADRLRHALMMER
jgi:hypothetical protein